MLLSTQSAALNLLLALRQHVSRAEQHNEIVMNRDQILEPPWSF